MLLKPGKMFLKLLWRSSFGWLLVRLMEPFSLRLRKPCTGSQRKGLCYTHRFINHWSSCMWKPTLGFSRSICSFLPLALLSSVAFGWAVHSCAIGAADTSARSAGLKELHWCDTPLKAAVTMETVGWHGKGEKILVHCKFIGGELSWCFSEAVQIRTRLKGLELFLKDQSLSEWGAWNIEKGKKMCISQACWYN